MTPELLIDTPEPEIDQVTVSSAVTEPSAVAPSLIELTTLLVVITGAFSSVSTTETVSVAVLVALPSLSVAVITKLWEVAVS